MDEKSIEAAATAIWMRRNRNRKNGLPETGLMRQIVIDDARAAIAAYRDAEIERLGAELAQLKSVPNTIYKAVEQVLDENSAWIARPSAEVTRRVAMAAGIVWAVQLEEKLGDAFQREQLVQGLRDYIRQLEMGMDALRAKLEAAERRPDAEYGWLVEDSRNHPSGIRYRTWGDFGPEWTNDPSKALRFARRQDAEMFARDDEDAWHIVEHMWPAIDAARGGERG